MTQQIESTVTVDERITAFLTKKALQYPKIGLTVINPKMIESTFKPLHEVVADTLIEKNSKAFVKYFIQMLSSYPLPLINRTQLR